MNDTTDERLYNLLPAIYRIRDVEHGEPLRALMAIIEGEFQRLERDMDDLYADWFVETCAEWVVPYISDLLGGRNLQTVGSAGIFSLRAYVANTLRYRRRKGTAPVLEQLARDVTGWPARAVEFFERLSTTQHVNHVRLKNVGTVDLRNASKLELTGTPFETATHTAEVRHIATQRGKYNIPNIGLFLWRLQPFFVIRSAPQAVSEADDGRYTFSPLGNDMPLFNRPQTETEITHLAEEINVPERLRRRALFDDLEKYRTEVIAGTHPNSLYFGLQPVLQIFFDNSEDPLAQEELLICDLSGWDEPGWSRPVSEEFDRGGVVGDTFRTRVAVDPVLGRLVILEDVSLPDVLAVSYAYGFSSDIGGGPYVREDKQDDQIDATVWQASIGKNDADWVSIKPDWASINEAIDDWQNSHGDLHTAILTILDSATYAEELALSLQSGQQLIIQSADQQRPLLRLLDGSMSPGALNIMGADGSETSLTLDGLLIEGSIHIAADSLEQLQLLHSTLVPGVGLNANGSAVRADLPSLLVEDSNSDLCIGIQHSITGPLCVPETISKLNIQDSIIQSTLRHGPATNRAALISGSLADPINFSASSPALSLRVGSKKPIRVALDEAPQTLSQARDLLEQAIQKANDDPALRAVRVITAANRLIILAGATERLVITSVEDDLTTAIELRLNDGSERITQALVTPSLSPFPEISAESPSLSITMGEHQGLIVSFEAPKPVSVPQARDQLHSLLRSAHSDPAFQNAIVANMDDQLVVLPGDDGRGLAFGTTAEDLTTLLELGLYTDRLALAGDISGMAPGPQTSMERVSVFGAAHVKEFSLLSETIFTAPAIAVRKQSGCTRFSFVPGGSSVPRRYRCQPDLALEMIAAERGISVDDLSREECEAVETSVTPTFTAVSYGDPGYAQLSRTCANEIRTGAEDGAEMGVFQYLKQPQREANLRTALQEYLRFGLEAGIFYIT